MQNISVFNILHGHVSNNIEISVSGWIRTRRDSKSDISFINLYDGSCIHSLQVIAFNTLKNYKKEILCLTSGCSITVIGKLINSIGSKQKIELVAKKIKVLGWIENPDTYPISAKKHTMEYLRNFAHLRPRTHVIGVISRIRHTLSYTIHNFMNAKGFIWVPTPIITTSDTEGNGKIFRIFDATPTKNICHISCDLDNINGNLYHNFFGKEAFLTVSGQLNAEAYSCALSKVYTFGPTFRAENSNTNRHLAEFWMIEPEIAFANLNDIIIFSESFLKKIIKDVLETHVEDFHFLSTQTNTNIIDRLTNFINIKFVHIEYNDAIKLLTICKKKFNNPIKWGVDLFSEHEKYLSEEYFQSPVVIKNYPKKIKAFYMRINNDEKTVASMDILLPGIGEIIGGSQREERLTILDQRLKEHKLSQENYWWYRDLRRYGTVPHSGFGLGFERLMIYITGIKNIRDIVPFPRTAKNINF